VVGLLSGWHPSPSRGSVSVFGVGTTITIDWTRVTYALTVTASGLPDYTNWSLQVNGTRFSTMSSVLTVLLPNGTYPWRVGYVPGYRPDIPNSTVTIRNSSAVFGLLFDELFYPVEFQQNGLPTHTTWYVQINGTNLSTSSGLLHLNLANGSYPFTVYTPVAYETVSEYGTLNVSGVPENVSLTFTPVPAILVGSVNPPGAVVMINGTAVVVQQGLYSIQLSPGTYVINVTADGYYSHDWTITVAPGDHRSLNLTLEALPPPPPPPSHNGSGSFFTTPVIVGLAVAVVVVLGAVALLLRRRRNTPPTA